jgi:hypothetical protein
VKAGKVRKAPEGQIQFVPVESITKGGAHYEQFTAVTEQAVQGVAHKRQMFPLSVLLVA